MRMNPKKFPTGWDEERVRELIEYYENQTDVEAAAEHEAALSGGTGTLMEVPTALVPLVRELIARYESESG
ncbi:MAG TPA: hypothetical protein VGG03_14765 [Thermoanaerobaculia bacterium]|jgi:hypothetical protein